MLSLRSIDTPVPRLLLIGYFDDNVERDSLLGMKAEGMIGGDLQHFMMGDCGFRSRWSANLTGKLSYYLVLLSYRNINVSWKIFVQLLKKLLQHIVPLRMLNAFKDLRYVNEVTNKLRS